MLTVVVPNHKITYRITSATDNITSICSYVEAPCTCTCSKSFYPR